MKSADRQYSRTTRAVASGLNFATAFFLWSFLDGCSGRDGVIPYLGLLNVALVGSSVFFIAGLLSLIWPTLGLMCGILAAGLSWPYLSTWFRWFPWGIVGDLPPLGDWPFRAWEVFMRISGSIFPTMFLMTISTADSVRRMRLRLLS
jgi:hypothetical protein